MLMKRFVVPLAAIFTLMLAGCASGPGYAEHAATMQPVGDGNGRIYMYRKSSLGAAVQPMVRVNDKEVGKAKPKGFFYVDLPPGTYNIAASTEAERNLDVTLDADEEMYVRLEIKMGAFVGHIKPVLVETTVGKEEIQKMKYVGTE
ncbi:MAG: DUF2846 domain-containing protein [Woeseiaceae bacterium]|nr:DUF2846 domain-containing protein [Woeseiaceae bacterium]